MKLPRVTFIRCVLKVAAGATTATLCSLVTNLDGKVELQNGAIDIPTGGGIRTIFIPLYAQELHAISISTPLTADSLNWCACSLDIVTGASASADFVARIFSGLIPPGGFAVTDSEFGTNAGSNPGATIVTQGAFPAAGAACTWTQTTFGVQEIISVSATLTTAAAVANRFVRLTVQADLFTSFIVGSINTQVAGTSTTYTLGLGANALSEPPTLFGDSLPAIRCAGMLTLSLGATNLQAGDQFTAMTVVLRAGAASQLQLISIPT